MTTMQDVATLAGVSAKTVSRVFNDDPHVAAETRERVHAALERLEYRPNMLARRFREGDDAAIGIAVPNIGDTFFASIIRSIEERAGKRSMSVFVTTLGRDSAREPASIERLMRRQISGMLIAPVSEDQGYLARWSAHTPIVFLDREPVGVSARSIVADDSAHAHGAVRHLCEHGHRRIAVIGDTEALVTTRRRLGGYRAALTEAGIARDPGLELLDESLWVFGYRRTEDAVAHVRFLLERADPPTAIFGSNAQCSMGIVRALHALGRTDIAVVSFGDFPMADALSPAITVIDQDAEGLARLAGDALFAAIDGDPAATTTTLRTELPLRLRPRGSGEIPGPSAAHRHTTKNSATTRSPRSPR